MDISDSQMPAANLACVTRMEPCLTHVIKILVPARADPTLKVTSVTHVPVATTTCQPVASNVVATQMEQLTATSHVTKKLDNAYAKIMLKGELVTRVRVDLQG